MSKENKKSNNLYWWVSGIALVGILLVILLLGGESNSSRIIISSIGGDATIFIDSIEERRVSGTSKNLTIKGVAPGFHSILIARDGFWPWLKEVQLGESESLVIEPFFVPQNSSGLIVPEGDPEYQTLLTRFNTISLPTFEKRKTSKSGNVSLWVDGGSLFVEWVGDEEERPSYYCNEFGCHSVLVPLGVGGDIRNIDFYKNREDVYIVSFGTGVFVIEADTTGNQNFQPIFEGEAPQFIPEDENSIYVLNNGLLLQVGI